MLLADIDEFEVIQTDCGHFADENPKSLTVIRQVMQKTHSIFKPRLNTLLVRAVHTFIASM